jgi:hypothetical protein
MVKVNYLYYYLIKKIILIIKIIILVKILIINIINMKINN